MTRAKQKGWAGETEIVALLEDHGIPNVHRNSASAESWDIRIADLSWPIEVKYRKRWDMMGWVRKIRAISEDNECWCGGGMDCPTNAANGKWAIFAIHGDRRTSAGREVGSVMVVDADFGAALLAHWVRES